MMASLVTALVVGNLSPPSPRGSGNTASLLETGGLASWSSVALVITELTSRGTARGPGCISADSGTDLTLLLLLPVTLRLELSAGDTETIEVGRMVARPSLW